MRRIEGEIVIDYRWGKCSTSLSMSETRRAAARASRRTAPGRTHRRRDALPGTVSVNAVVIGTVGLVFRKGSITRGEVMRLR